MITNLEGAVEKIIAYKVTTIYGELVGRADRNLKTLFTLLKKL